jgi:curved DNA-binding protein CbpA
MKTERRREARNSKKAGFSIFWRDATGIVHTADAQSLNTSPSGLAFNCDVEIAVDTVVYIAAHEAFTGGYSLVRRCRSNGGRYTIAVELDEKTGQTATSVRAESQNYYEFLQISPGAQAGTIHRVFRYLAGLYHPDNPETGDPERFLLLTRAYEVLSNVDTRAAYDAELNRRTRDEPSPAFAGVDFMDGVEGELNRRLAVMAVLYRQCRSNINAGRVSLSELEAQMAFPREYLDFTTWYLRSKKYITKEDNSDFALTVSGVDFIEENYARIPLLNKMLRTGTHPQSRNQSVKDASVAPPGARMPLILPMRSEASDVQLSLHEVASVAI